MWRTTGARTSWLWLTSARFRFSFFPICAKHAFAALWQRDSLAFHSSKTLTATALYAIPASKGLVPKKGLYVTCIDLDGFSSVMCTCHWPPPLSVQPWQADQAARGGALVCTIHTPGPNSGGGRGLVIETLANYLETFGNLKMYYAYNEKVLERSFHQKVFEILICDTKSPMYTYFCPLEALGLFTYYIYHNKSIKCR